MDYITLNNGVQMPVLGYGVYQVEPAIAENSRPTRCRWATV